jgi:flagellar motor switch protein FliN/FliY
MAEDETLLSQDDIDSLLAEGDDDDAGGEDAPEGEAGAEAEAAEAAGEPMAEGEAEGAAEVEAGGQDGQNLDDPSAWGLSDDQVDQADQPEPAVSPAPPSENFAQSAAVQVNVPRDIGFILDIPLQLRMKVGRTKVDIGSLLTYGPGSVVELNKLAGEALDVYVNDKLIARGEAVVVNEKFGIRLTDVVSKTERIENLT